MSGLKFNKLWIFLLIFAFFMPCSLKKNEAVAAGGEELKITSKSAILVDYNTGFEIYSKNADERLPIASMTKIASLGVVFDCLSKGVIKEDDLVLVSSFAAGVGGSSAFLDAGSKYKLCDLIKTVVVASANDSMVALAEYVAGSEESFVLKMNKKVSDLGLKNTNFINSTGLPAENHYSTASDMVKIYKEISNNALYKKYSKIWMEDFIHPTGRKTGLVNTNRLVRTFDGIDGGKTGYTDKARFCLTASATRGETRLIAVVIGAENSKTRFAEMSKLLNYGFSNYENKLLVNHEIPLTICNFKNAKNSISAYPEKDINKFLAKQEEFVFNTDFEIYATKAPIKKGDIIGKMFVFDKNNMVIDEVNVLAGDDAVEIGFKECLDKLISAW